jgi:hypothetical protein
VSDWNDPVAPVTCLDPGPVLARFHQEDWRDIPGWPGYQVSDAGQVRSFKQVIPRILAPFRHNKGYWVVTLWAGGARRNMYVHRLVADAFVPGRSPDRDQVNHLNHNGLDNRATNLSWVTNAENSDHRWSR